MLVLDREDAVAAWRRAEARDLPDRDGQRRRCTSSTSTMVRAVADELADVRTEDDLVDGLGRAPRHRAARSSPRHAPPMRALMDLEAVRDAAFCHRHREITREHGKEIARERLEQRAARAGRVGRAVRGRHAARLAPAGDARRAAAAALHASSRAATLDAGRPTYTLEVVQLDPGDGAWLLDKPPLDAGRRPTTPARNGRRASPRRARPFGEELTMDRPTRSGSSTRTATSARSRRGSSTTSSTR